MKLLLKLRQKSEIIFIKCPMKVYHNGSIFENHQCIWKHTSGKFHAFNKRYTHRLCLSSLSTTICIYVHFPSFCLFVYPYLDFVRNYSQ